MGVGTCKKSSWSVPAAHASEEPLVLEGLRVAGQKLNVREPRRKAALHARQHQTAGMQKRPGSDGNFRSDSRASLVSVPISENPLGVVGMS